jgi:hypothetical protein
MYNLPNGVLRRIPQNAPENGASRVLCSAAIMAARVAINRGDLCAVHSHPILKMHGSLGPPDSDIQVGAKSFAITTAACGAFILTVYVLLLIRASRLNIPELVLDEKDLRTPMVLWGWPLIRNVWVGKIFGSPVLCVSTINDEAVLKRFPRLFRWRFALRRRIFGAPIVLPSMRDTSFLVVCDLIDEYRSHFNRLAKPDLVWPASVQSKQGAGEPNATGPSSPWERL